LQTVSYLDARSEQEGKFQFIYATNCRSLQTLALASPFTWDPNYTEPDGEKKGGINLVLCNELETLKIPELPTEGSFRLRGVRIATTEGAHRSATGLDSQEDDTLYSRLWAWAENANANASLDINFTGSFTNGTEGNALCDEQNWQELKTELIKNPRVTFVDDDCQ
jgi:hypothetical protein